MSLMFMLWKLELISHNSFLSIFFPSLFSHFTRDFVEDFDILLMLKGCLKGDGKGRQQQREGGGGGGGGSGSGAAAAADEEDCGGNMTKVLGDVQFNLLFLLVWVGVSG